MTNKKTPVGILGGGISGLCTAYALAKKGISSTVYEKADKVGGAISSVRRENWLVEEGPNTIMVRTTALWNLLKELNLDDQLVEANEQAKKRYVVKNSEPVALPSSLGSFLTTPLLTAGAKLRLLKEPFVPSSIKQDESIASFVQRRVGQQPLDYGVNPFVSGIFAGDPKQLSIKHTFPKLWEMEQQHGSLLKGMFKGDRPDSSAKRALVSFKEGNKVLPQAMADALSGSVQTSTKITGAKKSDNRWQISGTADGTRFTQRHDCIVSTLPAYALSGVFGADLFEDMSKLPYVPLGVVALGFRNDQISHPIDGFGMLIPEIENYRTLGVLFSSTLFAGRAPEGHQLLTCFIGGARNPDLAAKSKKQLQPIIMDELEELLGIQGAPVFTHHRYWQRAIPQYKVGYNRYLSLMLEIEQQHSGLYMEGNFRNGVSVPDCISSAFETAQKVETFFKSKE